MCLMALCMSSLVGGERLKKERRYIYIYIYTAAAKSLQSCPTLCDPIDSSPPGSPVPGILKARTLEWVAISFSNAWKWKVKVKSQNHIQLLATPWTAAYQAPPSMGFARQERQIGVDVQQRPPPHCKAIILQKKRQQVIHLTFTQCYISINLGKNLIILALWDYSLHEFLTSCVNNGFQIVLIEA